MRITDSRNFTVSERIAAALVEIEPGAMRELHWHPNADEWQYYLSGQGRMTVFASGGKSRTFDYQAGDVGAVPFAMGHYVENTGDETLTFLEMFRSDHYADVSLSQWMGVLPPELVKAHLNLDDDVIAAPASYQARNGRLVSCLVDSFAVAFDGVEDLVGGLGPYEWLGVLVPGVDPSADLGVELSDGTVRAAA